MVILGDEHLVHAAHAVDEHHLVERNADDELRVPATQPNVNGSWYQLGNDFFGGRR